MNEILGLVEVHQKLLIFLFSCNMLDIATGFLKGAITKKLSSKIKPWKKFGFWCATAFGLLFDWAIGTNWATQAIVYCCISIEAVSLVENITEMGINIPVLSKMTAVLSTKGDDINE